MGKDFEDYFILGGTFASAIATIMLLVLMWLQGRIGGFDFSLLMETLLVMAVYFVLAVLICGLDLVKKIATPSSLGFWMCLTVFSAIEIFNIVVSAMQGSSYLPTSSAFIGNFLINRLVNFVVTACSVVLVFFASWLHKNP